MKFLPLILLACLSGCGASLIDATETRTDGTQIRTRVAAIHFVSDPTLAHAQHGSLVIDGFKGQTVVDAVKAVVGGLVEGVIHLFSPVL